MTVSSTESRKTYAGDGVTTSFATNPVVFFDDVDLTVYVVTTATGVVLATLTLGTHYSVTGGAGTTGTVNLAGGTSPYGAPATGTTLVIVRELDVTQESDFVNNDASDAEVAEDALDRLTMICQELDQRIERSFGLPDSSTNTQNQRVNPVAGFILGWDDAGAMTAIDPADVATVAASQGYSAEKHSGDGSGTTFVLASAPGSENNLDVFISGVRQTPGTDYSVSGSTVTFTTAPAAGTNNILFKWGAVLAAGAVSDSAIGTAQLADNAVTQAKMADASVGTAELIDSNVTTAKIADANVTTAKIADSNVTTGKLADGAVTHAKTTFNTGQVIQSVMSQDATQLTTSTVIPIDDTVPQSTEGDQIITLAITPKYAASKIRVRFHGTASRSDAGWMTAALFKDSDASALAAECAYLDTGNGQIAITVYYEETAGSTSARTYKVRGGPGTAVTMKWNGSTVARHLGGAQKLTLTVEEIAA